MTRIEDFSQETQDMVNSHIYEPFPDVIPVSENWFGGLTRRQLIFFEQYWRDNGDRSTPYSVLQALNRTRERQRKMRKKKLIRVARKSVVIRRGRRVVVWRDIKTGRLVKNRRGTFTLHARMKSC